MPATLLSVFFTAITLIFSAVTFAAEQAVVKDGEISISKDEMEAALKLIPSALRNEAAVDVGTRYELLNNMLLLRKLAAKADAASPDTPGYWELQFELLSMKRQFAFKQEMASVELPDMEALATEYYKTQKDKYATKPETRASSHILLASAPGLPREEVRAKAQQLLDELRGGADFEKYVDEYSNDRGSAKRGGALNSWMRFGDPGYTPPYSEALFTIENVGEYAEITDSQFGIHIIRLDGIREGGYYSFDEVKGKIYQDIATEFRSLAAKEISARYNITEDAFIDGDAMEELFAPYKPQVAE